MVGSSFFWLSLADGSLHSVPSGGGSATVESFTASGIDTYTIEGSKYWLAAKDGIYRGGPGLLPQKIGSYPAEIGAFPTQIFARPEALVFVLEWGIGALLR